MLPATRSRGNSSRAIENASGKIPPATPWITRATISTGSEFDKAASSVPAARMISVHSSRRSLPYMSPSRPMIDVPTEAESRKPVSSHVGAGLGGVQILLERRQRRDHGGAQHRVREPRQRQHREDHIRVYASAFVHPPIHDRLL